MNIIFFIFLLIILVSFLILWEQPLSILDKEKNSSKQSDKYFENLINFDFEEEMLDSDSSPLGDLNRSEKNKIEVTKDTNVRFSDVAGNEGAKKELAEVVQFLKNPEIFSRLGAEVPKGVLLSGPPGTGKTLLAKAVAGEAGIPFLNASGSQFVELLVGLGASRVRELFETARSLKPAIIFIDEIDAIARTRVSGANMGSGGNEEREQTLNQILTEMDGFLVDSGIVVIAATNRVDILDPAIKRPGRFDRQIAMVNPTLTERVAILQVHARTKKFDDDVSLVNVAQSTPGFSGADLANLLNEAAIVSTRNKKIRIGNKEIFSTIDRILFGVERKQLSRIKTRQLSAFNQVGPSLIGSIINKDTESSQTLTLTPRANSFGRSSRISSTLQYNGRDVLLNEIFLAISGRATEDLIYGYGECTTAGQRDFLQISRILRLLVIRYSMSRLQQLKQQAQLRNLAYLGSDVKTEILNIVDRYTTNLMNKTYKKVIHLLGYFRSVTERLADRLIEKEQINERELRYMIREYISNLKFVEILYQSREATLFQLIIPKSMYGLKELEASIAEFLEKKV